MPNNDYASLVKRRTPEAFGEGEFVSPGGAVIGRHEGHQHFTVGQRKGLRVAAGYPLYVIDIDAQSNRVMLGEKDALLKRTLVAREINLLDDSLQVGGDAIRCTAKIRYNHQPVSATAVRTGADELKVTFDEPQSAVTPGQAVVLYDGDAVIGGGWIDMAANDE